MENNSQIEIITQGSQVWNDWREKHLSEEVILSKADLRGLDLSNVNLANANLRESNLRDANLKNANLQKADLYSANLLYADLSSANLQYANLECAHLVEVNVDQAILSDCKVYGIASWGLTGIPRSQSGLIITRQKDTIITVDDLQVAQFIYLLLNNSNVRNVIDSITSKAVLLLGRFTNDRKVILDELHKKLRSRNYLPILFNFAGPENRDITETVSTLAHLARFVIADITDAKSVLQELRGIVPDLPSLPIRPILLSSQKEPGMFGFFQRFPWVLDTYFYDNIEEVINSIDDQIITPLEVKFVEVKPK